MDNYRSMFESRISAGAKEKLATRASGKLDAQTIYSWSCDVEGHAKKCVERYCELANKTTEELYKVATAQPLMTINTEKKQMDQWDNSPPFAHKLF